MLTAKRVIIATILGMLCGFFCLFLASSSPEGSATLTTNIMILIVIGRTMLGFTIGISALRLNWWLHGIVLGVVTSIPMAIPVLPDIQIFIGTFIMGIIYGVLIELVTTKLLKSPSPVFAA